MVPGGRYSIDFAVDVAIAKYADRLPLERQVRQMARDGLDVCGVEPRAYLSEGARRAILDPGTVTLPRDLK